MDVYDWLILLLKVCKASSTLSDTATATTLSNAIASNGNCGSSWTDPTTEVDQPIMTLTLHNANIEIIIDLTAFSNWGDVPDAYVIGISKGGFKVEKNANLPSGTIDHTLFVAIEVEQD